MDKFLALDKFKKFYDVIKFNGGIINSAYKLYKNDDLKIGSFVGEDKFGNKYYENKSYFVGRSRWVEYPNSSGVDFDASQVTAEWYGWLHYKCEDPPTVAPRKKYKWMQEHEVNKSGTNEAYMPYSTTRPKVESWVPPKSS